MLDQSLNRFRERLLAWFPERQFFHRTGGEVNFFVLGMRTQLALVCIGAIVLLWCLVTFTSLLWGQNPLRSSTKELRVQKEHYERYMVNLQAQETSSRELLAEQQKQFQLAAKNFESKHNTIVSMLSQGGIADTPNQTDSAAYTGSKIMMAAESLDPVKRTARAPLKTLDTLSTGTVLDASMVNLERDQNRILLDGEDNMLLAIDHYRGILSATGINVTSILQNATKGVGGTLVEIDDIQQNLDGQHLDTDGTLPPRLDTIRARANEVASLKSALHSAPLGFPIAAEHYQTSGFGIRKDPFTHRPTKHTGLDIASYRLAPIVATSDGRVTFSGTRGGYGRVIEIDHGHGFKTRYGHLAKSYVKRGAIVKQGDKIAGMGSTGRSTSTHLHYEILFENRTYDPSPFLKAGKYVQ